MFPDVLGQSWKIIILFQHWILRVDEENSFLNVIWEFLNMKYA